MEAERELVVVLSRREALALLRDASWRGVQPTGSQADSEALAAAFKKLTAALLENDRQKR